MPILNSLVKLKLEKCNNCQQPSSLGHLPYLKILETEEMNGVNHTGSEFYSGGESNGDTTILAVMFQAL
ncbi:hypothetical protein NC652_002334 [Populus alba x Populus x berolinensis]|nr:hypothetical protein NC652_002334 [Populus alba x Populus x berolinensis]